MRVRALLVLLSAAIAGSCGASNAIVGSGKMVDREEAIQGFTSVDIGSAFNATIKRGDAYKVTVSADDNLMQYVRVAKKGQTLQIDLKGDGLSVNNPHLRAEITLPELESVRLDGAAHAKMDEFKPQKPFKVEVDGASALEGAIEADTVAIHANGASKLELKGSAKSATVHADGASSLKLGEFAIDSADAKLDGAASAKLNVKSHLVYKIDGASHLAYAGRADAVGTKDGAASIKRQ